MMDTSEYVTQQKKPRATPLQKDQTSKQPIISPFIIISLHHHSLKITFAWMLILIVLITQFGGPLMSITFSLRKIKPATSILWWEDKSLNKPNTPIEPLKFKEEQWTFSWWGEHIAREEEKDRCICIFFFWKIVWMFHLAFIRKHLKNIYENLSSLKLQPTSQYSNQYSFWFVIKRIFITAIKKLWFQIVHREF